MPLPPTGQPPDDDGDDGSVSSFPSSLIPLGRTEPSFEPSRPDDHSNGEQNENGMTGNGEQKNETTGDGDELEDDNLRSFSVHHDKYQAAITIQPRLSERGIKNGELRDDQKGLVKGQLPNRKNPGKGTSSKSTNPVDDFMDAEFGNFSELDLAKHYSFNRRACILSDAVLIFNSPPQKSRGGHTPYELVYGKNASDGNFSSSNGEDGNLVLDGVSANKEVQSLGDLEEETLPPKTEDQGWFSVAKVKLKLPDFGIRTALLSSKTIRRILNFKESILKYGVFVPRNDNEANASSEHLRWSSGRQLEWMRLQDQGTFERNWDWTRVQKSFPAYRKRDIGHVFFVYDYKFTGEHRVRLVFDGSRQNPETYGETYAPTARGESTRLFHIFAVEERWKIAQYDVPQAFLKSAIDCDIFVHPPRNFIEFQGQLLKLKLSLYGAKQSAALWNQLIDQFLKTLGFESSPMDPCLYTRDDALIILYVDDLRVAATPAVLTQIHAALFERFQITTSDGDRFLGMDTLYGYDVHRIYP